MKRPVPKLLARASQAALVTAILVSLATDSPAQGVAAPASSTGAPSRASTVAIAVPWRGDPLDWHLTWSGATTLLQGIARLEPGCSLVSAEWDPGDGSGYIPIPTANPRILELAHVYTTPHHGTTFLATLRVTDNCGTTSTDTFRVLVLDSTLGVKASRALDHGLWHLHKQMTLSSSGGVDTGYWTYSYGGNYQGTPTGMALQAFQAQGHLETGDDGEDPYAENVRRGLAHLMALLSVQTIGFQPAGDPDANGNGIGLQVASNRAPYEGGPVVGAIVSSGTPGAIVLTGGPYILGRTYLEIVQDLLDCYSWGQTDSGAYVGGWRYSWNYSSSDNDVSRWWAFAALAGESGFGCIVPQFVKDLNAGSWLAYSQHLNGRFGYTSPTTYVNNGVCTTSSGMLQLTADGYLSSDGRFQTAEHYSVQWWTTLLNDNLVYGMHSVAAAMNLAQPSPIRIMTDGMGGTLDWFGSDTHGGDSFDGVARHLVETQLPDSSWDGFWVRDDCGTAFAAQILATGPPLVGPVAIAAGDPDHAQVNAPITFDGNGSFHLDPPRQIVTWEWDFDDDGFYDATGPVVTHAFPTAGEQLVRLRVTDDSAPPLTDSDITVVQIHDDPGIGFCFGDPGYGTPCPCNNDNDGSVPGSGCDNGAFASGAQLTGSGTASVSADTLVLTTAHLEPDNAGLYFQADNGLSPGLAWGDGLRCTGGQLKRLQVRFANAAGSSATTIGISANAGNVTAGSTKRYQCWYRTTVNPPCGPGLNDFNSSNGYEVIWLP